MRKIILFGFILGVVFSALYARIYTETENFTGVPSYSDTLVFDQYNGTCTLTKITVEVQLNSTQFHMEFDNDSPTATTVNANCGATGAISSDPSLHLLDASYQPIGASLQASDSGSFPLTADNGDYPGSGDPSFDSDTCCDWAKFDPNDGTDSDSGDIPSIFWSDYTGTGTFNIYVDTNTLFDTGGASGVAFQGVPGTASGYVKVTYVDDCPLPVTLSSFNAFETDANLAKLVWVTQSETNIAGYYIYRNATDDISTSVRVSSRLLEAVNSTSEYEYDFIDLDSEIDHSYYYWLEAVDLDASTEMFGPISVILDGDDNNDPPEIDISQVSRILSIYPNPFNPSTSISYYLAKSSRVVVEVFNVKGQKINQYDQGTKEGDATYYVSWDGKDFQNQIASSGIYLFKITTADKVMAKKAMLQK